MYLIKRTDQGGGFVAMPGSHSSYTKRLDRARVYATEEEADKDRCLGNEIVVPLPIVGAR